VFELACPWVLCALPLPWLIWYWIPRAPLKLPAALKIPFYSAMLDIVDRQKQEMAKQTKITLLFLIWILLLFALAGPRWVGEPQPVVRDGYNIMLALDISGSMQVNDMLVHGRPVTRLRVVKQAAEQFVQDRAGDRVGLILFGSRAYLQTPLTYDRHSVLNRIEDATVGLAGKTTSIGDALGLAVKRLQNVPAKGRMIILLTDGVNNSGVLPPLKAAELARSDGIKVYTIGLGSEVNPNAMGGMFFNQNVSAELDEDTLKEIAAMTGGRYFRATNMTSLQNIYQTINKMETTSQEQATVRPQHDYYPWPLSVAVLLLLFWFMERSGLWGKINRKLRREASS
jgi:Ca-activated chloride channel family protein